LSVVDIKSGHIVGAIESGTIGERDLHLPLDLPAAGSYRGKPTEPVCVHMYIYPRIQAVLLTPQLAGAVLVSVVVHGGQLESSDPALKNGRTVILSTYSEEYCHLDELSRSAGAKDAGWGDRMITEDPVLSRAVSTALLRGQAAKRNYGGLQGLSFYEGNHSVGTSVARGGAVLTHIEYPDANGSVFGFKNTHRRIHIGDTPQQTYEVTIAFGKKSTNCRLRGYDLGGGASVTAVRSPKKKNAEEVTVRLPPGGFVVLGDEPIHGAQAASWQLNHKLREL
jgi:hypothetical protein